MTLMSLRWLTDNAKGGAQQPPLCFGSAPVHETDQDSNGANQLLGVLRALELRCYRIMIQSL